MTHLTRPNSPLAQAAGSNRVGLRRSNTQLSPRDQATLKRVLTDKYEFIDHELFALPRKKAEREVFDNAPEIPEPDTAWYHPVIDAGSAKAAQQAGSVLLTAEQERALFIQFNYCRFRVCEIRDKIDSPQVVDPKLAVELLHWHQRAEALRDQIARTNLALVLAMAKRTRMSDVDFADLVSEGNMALLRAVDKFDAGRGFKFSTYACRAILKAFSRQGMKLSKYRQRFPTDFDPAMEKSNHLENLRKTHEQETAEEVKNIVLSNQADLTSVERTVIHHRFGIDSADESDPLTLEQVGQIIGVTKERVRQIQNKALEKIRNALLARHGDLDEEAQPDSDPSLN